MNAETTRDQAFTESALTPSPALDTRMATNAADRDLYGKSTLLWLLPRRAFCGRAAIGRWGGRDFGLERRGRCEDLRSDSARDSDVEEEAGRSRQQSRVVTSIEWGVWQAEAWLRATLSSIPTSGPLALLHATIQSVDCRLIYVVLWISPHVTKHSEITRFG